MSTDWSQIRLPADWPAVHALPVLPPLTKRNRRQWLDRRRHLVCASDIAAILGIPGAYNSAFALWWAKQEGWSTDEQTEEMEWGHRLEPAVARKFAERHPELRVIKPPASLWINDSLQWMGCTPDRLAVHRDYLTDVRPVELKTDQNHARWGDDPPDVYRVQLLWQCAVFGVRRGYLAALVGKRYREYDVEFAPEEIADAIREGIAFYGSLLEGEAPPIDAHQSTTEALELLNANVDKHASALIDAELVQRYESAHRAATEAKLALRLAENQLRAAMGSAGKAMDPFGRVFAQRLVFKRKGYEVPPTEIDMLRHVAPKDEDDDD